MKLSMRKDLHDLLKIMEASAPPGGGRGKFIIPKDLADRLISDYGSIQEAINELGETLDRAHDEYNKPTIQ